MDQLVSVAAVFQTVTSLASRGHLVVPPLIPISPRADPAEVPRGGCAVSA